MQTENKKSGPMWGINKNLISLKCVLFCFFSGVGCIFPYLPLHILGVGLNRSEARLISTIAPCVALLGPAILGPLLDKLSVGRGSTGAGPSGSGKLLRLVTAACLILSAVFYLLLLSVPHTLRLDARRPQVLFMCDENGAVVLQEDCTEGMRDNKWDGEKSGVLAMTSCEFSCKDQNMEWLINYTSPKAPSSTRSIYTEDHANLREAGEGADEAAEEETQPHVHVCVDGHCYAYLPHAPRMRVHMSLLAPENETHKGWVTYRTARPSHCWTPSASASCAAPAVRCAVLDAYDEPGSVLADEQCGRIKGDPDYTFWTYFVIRVLADIWPTSALALLGAACVVATRDTSLGRGDVGRQFAFGTIGLAIFPPLVGLAANQLPDYPYLLPFVMHAVFMVIAALIMLCDSSMPLGAPEWWWHTASGALALPLSAVRRYGAETAAVFLVLALLGLFWSAIDSYLPWILKAYSGDDTIVGLSMTAGAVPAVLALWWAEIVVDYLGHSNIFIAAFAFYSLRFVGIAFSTSYEWLLVCEVLEVFTLSLVWVTAVLYFRHLVPRKYTATGQALPVIAHFCLGRCIGSIVGGLMGSLEGGLGQGQGVQCALAVASLATAAAYLALYHAVLAPRCHAPAQPPQAALLQGLNTNGSSNNGSYSPLRVYHEERARKGQFRY